MRVAVALFLLAAAVPQDDATFSAALRRLAAPSPAVTGVAIMHLPSGRTASLNGAQRFPMMSVYKLPIVVHALRRAEAGTLDVGERVTLAAADRRPGRSRLSEQIAAEGPVTLTVRDLLERIVRESDNAASDRVLRIVGGPNAVAETLRSLRIEGIDVSRYELEFAADYYGVCCLDKLKPYTLERFFDAVEAVPPGRRRTSAQAYLTDRRDSATPWGLATLAARLQRGELLNADNTRWLLGQMQQMTAVAPRLGGELPPGTPVARRPGTSGATDGITAAHNETAIITLPDGRGHLVVSVFLKGVAGDSPARDRIIARIGRAAYDWAMNGESK